MVTKHQIKLIKSLSQKKYRQQFGLFTVEGIKGIEEFLNSDYKLEKLYTTELMFSVPERLITVVSETELKKITALKTPNTALALFKISESKPIDNKNLIIALDDVRDPGNLGTIIRLCDWYGIKDLVCSTNTVDCFNPKVVQATMGSLSRINISYLNLEHYITTAKTKVFGTFMYGENIYNSQLQEHGIVILGNEANGISDKIKSHIDRILTIPQFGNDLSTESLNVASATAIVLSEFRRRLIER